MKFKEPCGCTHNGIEWLNMCDAHRNEANLTSQRWAAERLNPPSPTNVTYHGQAKPLDSLHWLDVPAGT